MCIRDRYRTVYVAALTDSSSKLNQWRWNTWHIMRPVSYTHLLLTAWCHLTEKIRFLLCRKPDNRFCCTICVSRILVFFLWCRKRGGIFASRNSKTQRFFDIRLCKYSVEYILKLFPFFFRETLYRTEEKFLKQVGAYKNLCGVMESDWRIKEKWVTEYETERSSTYQAL